ncbi:hypothetical protein [Curtobacterium sp. VKM Ac-2884]|uniref:WDGH domain-containing protein n=1 Tax=Curtobacterium sp. VKM Ac-2884 TaxID=2783818 RepID=UPI00188BD5B3|nr:hypothetical protein [Curtobacterium sp. VKM Ac-2884]MBF4603739.1 hypothetical protein [Curtobacterium sp. VKM Ac-2884]
MSDEVDYPGLEAPLVERVAWARHAGVMSLFAKKALKDAEDALRAEGDEHHTLDELYEYRMLYNALLFNEWERNGTYPVVKSMQHSDGEDCFGGGWFIVVAELPTGQISNHYRLEHWDLFQVRSVALPPEYDGHTPADAAKRMLALLSQPTPTTEPFDLDSPSCATPTPTAQDEETVAPPSIADMVPGTTFTAAATDDVWRWAVREDGLIASALGVGPMSALDPSTIRDVTPPPATPREDR